MIVLGIPPDGLTIKNVLPSMQLGRKNIVGSAAGGIAETQEMLDFCTENNIVSDNEIIVVKDIETTFERMKRVILNIALSSIWLLYSCLLFQKKYK